MWRCSSISAEIKLSNYVINYGIEAVNLCIKRHKLSTHKRSFWSYQYFLYKQNQENFSQENQDNIDKIKSDIEQLTKEINEIDGKLTIYGINEVERKNIIRTAKNAYPDNWEEGFL